MSYKAPIHARKALGAGSSKVLNPHSKNNVHLPASVSDKRVDTVTRVLRYITVAMRSEGKQSEQEADNRKTNERGNGAEV